MTDPGPPSTVNLGYMTEAQLRSIAEFNGGYTNRVGIPDTKAGLRTRANASWARLMTELWVQLNEIFRGTITVPGIALASGAKWRPGDDGAQAINDLSIAGYGIATPTSVWPLDDDNDDIYSVATVNTTGASPTFAMIYSPVAVKGSYTLADNIVYGGRTYYQAALATVANYSVPVVCAASITFRAAQWNQANEGIVLLTNRSASNASSSGASYRLGFELGLGVDSGSTNVPQQLCLYYRHSASPSEAAITRFCTTASGARVHLSPDMEWTVGFIRTATTLRFFVNGIEMSSHDHTSSPPVPGSALDVIMGGTYGGLRYLDGYVRNVAIWTSAQPDAGDMRNVYLLSAGHIAKVLPT